MAKIYLFILFVFPLLFLSCAGDCKVVEIEKAEWFTHDENYQVDTLVNYSVKDSIKLVEYSSSTTNRDLHYHYVTIHNNNTLYSNRFAVQFSCSYSYDNPQNWIYTTDYVEISPNSEYTFSYGWYGAIGIYDSDFSVNTEILQSPQRITLTRRIDELQLSKITVNTCEQDVEALEKQYHTIKDLYNEKVNK